jgi:hypothetical protein
MGYLSSREVLAYIKHDNICPTIIVDTGIERSCFTPTIIVDTGIERFCLTPTIIVDTGIE